MTKIRAFSPQIKALSPIFKKDRGDLRPPSSYALFYTGYLSVFAKVLTWQDLVM